MHISSALFVNMNYTIMTVLLTTISLRIKLTSAKYTNIVYDLDKTGDHTIWLQPALWEHGHICLVINLFCWLLTGTTNSKTTEIFIWPDTPEPIRDHKPIPEDFFPSR